MEFDLASRTVYAAVTGSHAYGMANKDSDVDVRGVGIAPLAYYTGFLRKFKQADSVPDGFWEGVDAAIDDRCDPINEIERIQEGRPDERALDIMGTTDIQIMDIRKFVELAADANPNILEQLFLPERCIIVLRRPFLGLRDMRDKFLSQKVRHSFAGYAHSQIKRIRGHRRWLQNPPKAPPSREDFGLPKELPIPNDQFRAAESMIERRIQEWMIDPDEEIPVTVLTRVREAMTDLVASVARDQDPEAAMLRTAGHQLGFDENFIMLLDKERKYRQAKKDWKNYNTWLKERNSARAEMEARWGYDTKHASHVVRLTRMCEELLTFGQLRVDRKGIDADELLAIRGGAWTYDMLEEFADDIDRRMDGLYGAPGCPLPREPDRKGIDRVCREIIQTHATKETF